jgi:hypothetical protein
MSLIISIWDIVSYPYKKEHGRRIMGSILLKKMVIIYGDIQDMMLLHMVLREEKKAVAAIPK